MYKRHIYKLLSIEACAILINFFALYVGEKGLLISKEDVKLYFFEKQIMRPETNKLDVPWRRAVLKST